MLHQEKWFGTATFVMLDFGVVNLDQSSPPRDLAAYTYEPHLNAARLQTRAAILARPEPPVAVPTLLRQLEVVVVACEVGTLPKQHIALPAKFIANH